MYVWKTSLGFGFSTPPNPLMSFPLKGRNEYDVDSVGSIIFHARESPDAFDFFSASKEDVRKSSVPAYKFVILSKCTFLKGQACLSMMVNIFILLSVDDDEDDDDDDDEDCRACDDACFVR